MSLNCFFQPITEAQVKRFSTFSNLPSSDEIDEELDQVLEDAEDSFDLGKAWHALHFLLAGHPEEGPEPLCYILHGGTLIYGIPESEDDTGRILTIEQVVNFNHGLSSIGEDELRSRFNLNEMIKNEIYPDVWDDENIEDSLEFVVENYEPFRADISRTVRDGKGLLVFIG